MDSGSVVRVSWEDFVGLDPTRETKTSLLMVVRANVFDGLVERNAEGEIVPALATAWELLNDVTWRFKLQENVVFHNGEPFTAEAVKFTLEKVSDPAWPQAFLWGAIDKVDVEDGHTVLIHTKIPFGPLLAHLSIGAILPPRAYDEKSFATHPIGTGPFQCLEWQPGQELVLGANPRYWKGPAKVDRVMYYPNADAGSRVRALRAGELDIIFEPPSDELSVLENDPNINVVRVPGADTPVISVCGKHAPYDQLKVREALHLAIDREAIVNEILQGLGQVPRSTVSPGVFGFNPYLPQAVCDPQRTRELLAEAGYPDGFAATLVIPEGVYAKGPEIGQMVAQQLSRVGIRLKLEIVSEDKAWPRMGDGQFDLFLNGWSELTLDADYNLYFNFHSVSREGCQNPEIDRLLEQGRSTLNEDIRKEVYYRLQALLMRELYRVPLYHSVDVWAIHKRIKRFVPRPNRMMHLWDITLD